MTGRSRLPRRRVAQSENVTALMGTSQRDMLDGTLWMTLVHNPLARMSLPREILGASKEYVPDDAGDHFSCGHYTSPGRMLTDFVA
jgi:hypothetical protein